MLSDHAHAPCGQCGRRTCLDNWKPGEDFMREHAQALLDSTSAMDVLKVECRVCFHIVAAGWGYFGGKPVLGG